MRRQSTFSRKLLFYLGTLFLIFFTYDLSTFLHEWTHGLIAWIAGYKESAFAIHYPTDWIFLSDVDEAVDYQRILSDGKPAWVAWIAITPTFVGAALFLLGLFLINSLYVQKERWLYSFCYWFTLMNLGQVLDYIPIRTFSSKGDIANFALGSGFSRWSVLLPGAAFLIWGIYRLFVQENARAYRFLKLEGKNERRASLFIALLILFGYFGGVGFTQPDFISHSLSLFSWALIPVLFFLFQKKAAQSP